MRKSVVALPLAAAVALIAGSARAVDVAPYAVLDVSRWSDMAIGYSELDTGPAAVRDGNPGTAWRVPGDEGQTAWMTLDWSAVAGSSALSVETIRVDVSPADASIEVEAGMDLGTFTPLTPDEARDATGATLTLPASATLRVIRLRVAAQSKVSRIEVDASASAAAVPPLAADCTGGVVHLHADSPGLVAITREVAGAPDLDLGVFRATDSSTFLDATVRFDPRPATYRYHLQPLGQQAATTTSTVTCDGAPLTRPAQGPTHGVIEGFYGRPWTWHEREAVVRAMGALGADTYFYAPKDEPKHRDQWRSAYSQDELDHFARLSAIGRAVGVNVVYAISPGIDIDPTSPADVQALTDKLATMATGAGIRDAALLMDDLDPKVHPHGAALAAVHASLATTLLASMRARDPAAKLWFVPTVYSGLAPALDAGDAAYLGALSALPADVPIAWTGDGVFSQTLKLSDAAAFVALAGRGPEDVWIWDNYPANDVTVFRRLYARPITGRESLLPDGGGLVSNPMRHALASLPAITSYAELARDPSAYAADRKSGRPLVDFDLGNALAAGGPAPAGLVDFFAELVHHDTIWPNDFASPALTQAVAAYLAAPTAGQPRADASRALATVLAKLARADVDIRRDVGDQALADEIDAYARTTSGLARAVLDAMTADRAMLLGDIAGAASARHRSGCARTPLFQPSWRTIQEAVTKLLPDADADCSDASDPFGSDAPIYAVVGLPWALDFRDAQGETSGAWSLVAPDGATLGDDGHVAWTPDRLGHFRLVVIRTGPSGAAARVLDLVVVEALPESGTTQLEAGGSGCSCAAVGNPSTRRPCVLAIGLALGLAALRRRARETEDGRGSE